MLNNKIINDIVLKLKKEEENYLIMVFKNKIDNKIIKNLRNHFNIENNNIITNIDDTITNKVISIVIKVKQNNIKLLDYYVI